MLLVSYVVAITVVFLFCVCCVDAGLFGLLFALSCLLWVFSLLVLLVIVMLTLFVVVVYVCFALLFVLLFMCCCEYFVCLFVICCACLLRV